MPSTTGTEIHVAFHDAAFFYIREDHKGGRIRNGGLIVEDGRITTEETDGARVLCRGWVIL